MSDSSFVINVTETNFDADLVDADEDIVFMVDFWAPWCGPCHLVEPLLENVAHAHKGRVILAKIDIDESPTLRKQFRVEGIPAVKIMKAGMVVDEFVGSLPEEEIHRMLRRHLSDSAQ